MVTYRAIFRDVPHEERAELEEGEGDHVGPAGLVRSGDSDTPERSLLRAPGGSRNGAPKEQRGVSEGSNVVYRI